MTPFNQFALRLDPPATAACNTRGDVFFGGRHPAIQSEDLK